MLRGAALALVMLRHAWPSLFPGAGIVGVVMFFTLSGYLITASLRREWEEHGRVDFAEFSWRRAARLVPALLLVVAAFVVVTLVWDPLGDREVLASTVAVALTWTSNIPGLDASAAMFHLWTLALEEQFYLVWPLLVVTALARGRAVAAIWLSAALCLILALLTVARLSEKPDLAYPLPTPWAVALVVGAGISLVPRLRHRPRPGVPAAAIAWIVLGALALTPMRGHAVTYVAAAPVVALVTTVLIRRAGLARAPVSRSMRGLAWLGVISYSAYLWNYPFTLWLRPCLGDWAGPLAAASTIAVAWASYRMVEEPTRAAVLRWRTRVRSKKGGPSHGG
ncbi:acyltransferase family protein [Demequina aestuarii]|uniref:acyltransferase family protein n=1 Tax=Demequina aestuarii TaxID=327095 RepID=UPI001EE74B97|nr:acyltransferase [Demequina aestuarii]